MTKFLQIILLIVAVLWLEANGTPLFQGISFQRGFEINFKPLPRNPITFIKEKWSPFGRFGRKHSLQKRNSGSGDVPIDQARPVAPLPLGAPEPRSPAPVFEHIEETEHLRITPITALPHQSPRSVAPLPISSPESLVSPIQPQLFSPGPRIISSPPSSPMPLSVIVTPVPHPVFSNVPPSITKTTSDMLLQPPVAPMEGSLPPISSNMVIPPPVGRFTDVLRAEPVKEYLNSVQYIPPVPAEKAAPQLEVTSVKPAPPGTQVPNENALVRGSKVALYYGSIFLQLMSQFMRNARATLDQMTNPKPIYNN